MRRFEYNEQQYTTKEICDVVGICYKTLQQRLKNGWSIERIMTTPPMDPKQSGALSNKCSEFVYLYNGEWLTLKQIANIENIPYSQADYKYVKRESTRLQRKDMR